MFSGATLGLRYSGRGLRFISAAWAGAPASASAPPMQAIRAALASVPSQRLRAGSTVLRTAAVKSLSLKLCMTAHLLEAQSREGTLHHHHSRIGGARGTCRGAIEIPHRHRRGTADGQCVTHLGDALDDELRWRDAGQVG